MSSQKGGIGGNVVGGFGEGFERSKYCVWPARPRAAGGPVARSRGHGVGHGVVSDPALSPYYIRT